jgi:hypothetical protein
VHFTRQIRRGILAMGLSALLCGTTLLARSAIADDVLTPLAVSSPNSDQHDRDQDHGGDREQGADRDHGGHGGDHDDDKRARVVTYHNDVRRTGWNRHERILTPQTVSQASFGLLKTVELDDQVDAEPLLV